MRVVGMNAHPRDAGAKLGERRRDGVFARRRNQAQGELVSGGIRRVRIEPPGTGNPEKDFKREWNNLVVEPFKAEPNPATETEAEDGWTAIGGGTAIQFQGTQSAAFLTVISGGGKTISILSVFNKGSYAAQVAAFASKIELGKAVAEIPTQPDESSPANARVHCPHS